MGLRDKYAYAIQTAKGKFDGSAQERDGKLHFDVYVLAGEKLNRVEVDATGKAGKTEEVKEMAHGHAAEKKPAPKGG